MHLDHRGRIDAEKERGGKSGQAGFEKSAITWLSSLNHSSLFHTVQKVF